MSELEPTKPDPETVAKALAKAYELAELPLSGIDDAAHELATLCVGNVAVIEAVRRAVAADLETSPNRRNQQAASLIRRALEVGEWDWEAHERPG